MAYSGQCPLLSNIGAFSFSFVTAQILLLLKRLPQNKFPNDLYCFVLLKPRAVQGHNPKNIYRELNSTETNWAYFHVVLQQGGEILLFIYLCVIFVNSIKTELRTWHPEICYVFTVMSQKTPVMICLTTFYCLFCCFTKSRRERGRERNYFLLVIFSCCYRLFRTMWNS